MPFPKRIGLLLAASLVASCLAFLIVTLDSGKMNVEAQAEPQRERQVENKIPKHVPITIKLKRDKEVPLSGSLEIVLQSLPRTHKQLILKI